MFCYGDALLLFPKTEECELLTEIRPSGSFAKKKLYELKEKLTILPKKQTSGFQSEKMELRFILTTDVKCIF